MRRIRSFIKRWLYDLRPGAPHAFPYYGVRVHFPPRSFLFRIACDQGIYEPSNVQCLMAALRPGSLVIDAGANIGLMSIPLLAAEPGLRVISIEPSPVNQQALERTIAGSPYADRWQLVKKALGATEGEATFHCAAPAWGAFDGLADTKRVGPTTEIRVAVTTLDKLWDSAGRPPVCAIKIDVEGAEAAVLQGAGECIRSCRPVILLEWNPENLAAFNVQPGFLMDYARGQGYDLHALPSLARVETAAHLRTCMRFGENFLLLPKE